MKTMTLPSERSSLALDGSEIRELLPDTDQNIGGVPLGLTIAEDIFNDDGKKRMEKSNEPPRA